MSEKANPSLTPRWLALVVALGWAGSVMALFFVHAVPPRSYPPLTLNRAAMTSVVKHDRDVAKQSLKPELQQALEEVRRKYLDQGLAEVNTRETKESDAQRTYFRKAYFNTLKPADRKEVSGHLCAWATHRLDQLFETKHLNKVDEWPHDLVGSFAAVMERYGLVHQNAVTGPTFVFRTLFKARCNSVMELPLTYGFDRVELQAYHGWLALQVPDAPLVVRKKALEEYALAGGAAAREATGVLAFQQEQPREAALAFDQAYHQQGHLWLRNYYTAAAARQK